MQVSHTLPRLSVAFSDRHAVADAGLLLPATLAEKLRLRDLICEHVDLGGAPGAGNAGAKGMAFIFSALAGGDCIDDTALLRSGSTEEVLGMQVRAPSTLGTFLRSFTWGHALQLDAVSRRLLARAWSAGAGPQDAPFTIDVDSTICETYGLKKAGGSRFTYTHVRGYHPLLAVAAGTGEVLHARLRGGPANTCRGASRFIAETITRVRGAGSTGPLTLRADSGFYSKKVVEACRKRGVRFSITMRIHKTLRATLAALPEEAWEEIPYFLPGAGVAETTYTPFGRKGTPVRLIVRRVPPNPGSQMALFATYDYHAFITDREGETLTLEADHRRHAEI
jgi:Transposase DDE domain group 1